MPLLRLDKIISGSGAASRREVKRLVKQGRITVDGLPARSSEEKCDADASDIRIDGKRVDCAAHFYYMLNKPAGVLTATRDRDQKTVIDLLPERLRRQGLFPAGRLDKDTSGLLILTNDGDFAYRVTSPGRRVPKLYRAAIDGEAGEADVAAFEQGITLADGTRCLPARLEVTGGSGGEVLVTVYEGKYHQVKRMLAAVGKPVVRLERIAVGGLALDPGLAPGEYKALTAADREAVLDTI